MNEQNSTVLKKTAALGAAALAGTLLSGCAGLTESGTYDRDQAYEFRTMQDGEAKSILPIWVPGTAKHIKEVQRTTGNERVLTFQTGEKLPSSCIELDQPGVPSLADRMQGLSLEQGKNSTDEHKRAADQYLEPLIQTDWWPQGQEAKTTHLCGKWWVSIAKPDTVYAFAPETNNVAQGVLKERKENQ